MRKTMKWVWVFLLLALPSLAFAQPKQVIPVCGGVTLHAGDGNNGYVDATGNECIAASSNSPIPGPAPGTPVVGANNTITSLVLLATPTTATGGVKYFHAENATTTGGYCILYNATAAPAPGALTAGLVLAFQLLPASGYCDWTATNNPIAASAGATVLVSSAATPFTYTTGVITASVYGLAQ